MSIDSGLGPTRYRCGPLLGCGTFGCVFEAYPAPEGAQDGTAQADCVLKKQLFTWDGEEDQRIVKGRVVPLEGGGEGFAPDPLEVLADEEEEEGREPTTPAPPAQLALTGALTLHRELSVTIGLGKQLDVCAILAEEARWRAAESAGLLGTSMGVGRVDASTSTPAPPLPTATGGGGMYARSGLTPLPLVPPILDAFLAYQPHVGGQEGGIHDVATSLKHEDGSVELCTLSQNAGRDLWVCMTQEPSRFSHPGLQAEIARQLLCLVAELHARGLVHRDIKPQNVLVDFAPRSGWPLVRLCDMGSVRTVPTAAAPGNPFVVSRFYRAPELLCCSQVYGTGVDVWALALTLAELYALPASLTDKTVSDLLTSNRDDWQAACEDIADRFSAAVTVTHPECPLLDSGGRPIIGADGRPVVRKARVETLGRGTEAYQKAARTYRRELAQAKAERSVLVQLFPGINDDAGQLLHVMNLLGTPTEGDILGMALPVWSTQALTWMTGEVQSRAARTRAHAQAVAAGTYSTVGLTRKPQAPVAVLPVNKMSSSARFRGVTNDLMLELEDAARRGNSVESLEEELASLEEASKQTRRGAALTKAQLSRLRFLRDNLRDSVNTCRVDAWRALQTRMDPLAGLPGRPPEQPGVSILTQQQAPSPPGPPIPVMNLTDILTLTMRVPLPLARILTQMLTWNPATRLSARGALESPFMEQLAVSNPFTPTRTGPVRRLDPRGTVLEPASPAPSSQEQLAPPFHVGRPGGGEERAGSAATEEGAGVGEGDERSVNTGSAETLPVADSHRPRKKRQRLMEEQEGGGEEEEGEEDEGEEEEEDGSV